MSKRLLALFILLIISAMFMVFSCTEENTSIVNVYIIDSSGQNNGGDSSNVDSTIPDPVGIVIGVPSDYPTIQLGIAAASTGDTVLVAPGTYTESINFQGKLITVKSSDGPHETIITNSSTNDLVVFSDGETSEAVIEGFTLLGGHIAIKCENSGPTIKYNILRNQNVSRWGAISLGGEGYANLGPSPAVIINNTITGCNNGGISTFSTVAPTYRNNIVAFNSHYAFHRHSSSQPHPIMSHNCVFGHSDTYQNISNMGDGHLDLNPMFNLVFGLQASSPCINAGNPAPIYNDPDGSQNDMGAVPCGQ